MSSCPLKAFLVVFVAVEEPAVYFVQVLGVVLGQEEVVEEAFQ